MVVSIVKRLMNSSVSPAEQLITSAPIVFQEYAEPVSKAFILVNGTTYDRFGYADANLSQFEQFDIGAKFAIGKEILPKLHFFWELSSTIPFFPIQNHPAYVSILNKGKMNSLLCFSFRYLLSEK